MTPALLHQLNAGIRDIADFPKPGILFKDITPVLADPALFEIAIEALLEPVRDLKITKVAGIDARGFIFGSVVASRLGVGLIPVRKKGKLPYQTHSLTYDLEYGQSEVEIHIDAVAPGENVYLVDDLLATGGTAAAAQALIQKVGGNLVATGFLIELEFLKGRDKLSSDSQIHSILRY